MTVPQSAVQAKGSQRRRLYRLVFVPILLVSAGLVCRHYWLARPSAKGPPVQRSRMSRFERLDRATRASAGRRRQHYSRARCESP